MYLYITPEFRKNNLINYIVGGVGLIGSYRHSNIRMCSFVHSQNHSFTFLPSPKIDIRIHHCCGFATQHTFSRTSRFIYYIHIIINYGTMVVWIRDVICEFQIEKKTDLQFGECGKRIYIIRVIARVGGGLVGTRAALNVFCRRR